MIASNHKRAAGAAGAGAGRLVGWAGRGRQHAPAAPRTGRSCEAAGMGRAGRMGRAGVLKHPRSATHREVVRSGRAGASKRPRPSRLLLPAGTREAVGGSSARADRASHRGRSGSRTALACHIRRNYRCTDRKRGTSGTVPIIALMWTCPLMHSVSGGRGWCHGSEPVARGQLQPPITQAVGTTRPPRPGGAGGIVATAGVLKGGWRSKRGPSGSGRMALRRRGVVVWWGA